MERLSTLGLCGNTPKLGTHLFVAFPLGTLLLVGSAGNGYGFLKPDIPRFVFVMLGNLLCASVCL